MRAIGTDAGAALGRSSPAGRREFSIVRHLIFPGLALSIGWGIRGNFGHEYGAMIPGVLAAMAAVLASGRSDWMERLPEFAFLGALGWSFGGTMSYMQVIGYTHSGDSLSVWYGFACLFVIGFLWAVMGGAGTALAGVADRRQLRELSRAVAALFGAWALQNALEWIGRRADPAFFQRHSLDWNDTDWIAAITAAIAGGSLALVRRRWDFGSRLVCSMAVGWWAGFLILVAGFGLRMTPPRGDNWAGCLGMTAALLIFLWRAGLRSVFWAALIAGWMGGFGFATATFLKLAEITSGWATNWHSILEQTYGLFNGIGIGWAMWFLGRRAAPLASEPARWLEKAFALGVALLAIPYLNLSKNPRVWVASKAMGPVLYGLPAWAWFQIGYALLFVLFFLMLWRHRQRPLELIPSTALGVGQLLFLVFLWWMALGNFARALVGFSPERLVTEGALHVNAVLCTILAVWIPPAATPAPDLAGPPLRRGGGWTAAGVALALILVTLEWAGVRAMYGDRFAGYAGKHIRFGPHATIHSE